MRRGIAFGVGAMLAFVACSNAGSDGFGYGGPPSFGSGSSTASSSGGFTGGGSVNRIVELDCTDRPSCGNRGCCPPGWRCLRDRCVAPGVACTSDAECSASRYCALALAEPRCFPRETFCDPDGGASEDCAPATCVGPDVHLADSDSICSKVGVYLYNFGGAVLPPGAIVTVERRRKPVARDPSDAGDDAGDGGGFEAFTNATTDGILPGEVVLMVFPLVPDYDTLTTARVDHDAGAAVSDCNPGNDSEKAIFGCRQTETP